MRLFSDVWSENAALFERLMAFHSNPPILYYGFKIKQRLLPVYIHAISRPAEPRKTIFTKWRGTWQLRGLRGIT